MIIKTENGKFKFRYYDRNGKEIVEGCTIRYESGRESIVYGTDDRRLGTDATNPKWIAKGRAVPLEYGIYPLTIEETEEVEVVD